MSRVVMVVFALGGLACSTSGSDGASDRSAFEGDADQEPTSPSEAPNNTCACAWEGGVTFQLKEVRERASEIFVRGTFKFDPCCSTSSTEAVVFLIDAATGATSRAETVPQDAADVPFDLTGTAPILVGAGTIELEREIMVSISCCSLQIGAHSSDAGAGTAIYAPIRETCESDFHRACGPRGQ